MAVYLSPVFGAGTQLFDSQGRVLASGTINSYLAGTTTPAATYTDNTGGTPNSVNIPLDSAGRPSQEIWLTGGVKYKFIVLNSLGVQQGPTWDNISGVNDPGVGGGTAGIEWVAGTTPTYINATQFSVATDLRATYPVGQRIKATVSGGTIYGTVSAVAFSSVTTVTIVPDSTNLDAGLSAVWYGILNAAFPSEDALGVSYKNSIVAPAATAAEALQRADRYVHLNTTAGSGSAYTLASIVPALPAYSTSAAPFLVKFHADASGSPTLAISGLSPLNLKQVDSTGAKVAATLKGGTICDVVYDGTDLVATVPVLVGGGGGSLYAGRYLRTTVFTSNGTWTKGTDCGLAIVQGVGGGGGGGSVASSLNAGGGGGGGYFRKTITSPSASYGVTVGTGGGVGTAAGTAGGNSILSTMTAVGGSPGASNVGLSAGGDGGGASGGDYNAVGGGGGYSGNWQVNTGGTGGGVAANLVGAGGNSVLGGGGYGGVSVGAASGGAGGAYGGGGGGGSAGAAGVIIVDEYSS